VRNVPPMNIYETSKLLHEYLLFHYGSDTELLPWADVPQSGLHFPQRTVTELMQPGPIGTALDLGCAVGRSSFELSALCTDSVVGIDYSHAFVNAAEQLRTGASLAYQRVVEASVTESLQAQRPSHAKPERIRFEQGDAMTLRADLGSYDLVHAANLLCRLTQPKLLLERLPQLVRPGGQLLLTTPCTWLAEYTPVENWPTGRTLDWLQELLSEHFTLELRKDMPFVIRETERKYQWTVALGMRWRRKG
jgi:putative 4-mercaptohistidine N1-methyltranferase